MGTVLLGSVHPISPFTKSRVWYLTLIQCFPHACFVAHATATTLNYSSMCPFPSCNRPMFPTTLLSRICMTGVELGVVDALEIIFYTCTVNGGFITMISSTDWEHWANCLLKALRLVRLRGPMPSGLVNMHVLANSPLWLANVIHMKQSCFMNCQVYVNF